MLQGTEGPLQRLVDVRVEGAMSAERAVVDSCRLVKIREVTVLFQTVQRMGNRDFMKSLQPGAPEAAFEFDLPAWFISVSPRKGGSSAHA